MNAFCAAVDWGTSTFRLWILDRDGEVLAERRSGEGMMDAGRLGFATVLEKHLSAVGADEELPAIVTGMAGARQGWMEAGYVDTPAEPRLLASGAVRPACRRDVRILPGVAQRNPTHPDVMRGEETQIVGLLDLGVVSGTVCLPGTHSKWVEISDGRIARFSTFMTGETFALFRKHSILSHDAEGEASAADPAFAKAVGDALAAPERFLDLVFSVRSASLLGVGEGRSGASRLSGLLIGLELAGARNLLPQGRRATLVSSGSLFDLYGRAFQVAGIAIDPIDADDATRRGLLAAARSIWSGAT